MATRKSSSSTAAAKPSRGRAFLAAVVWTVIGMGAYGITIDARAVTWPAATAASSAVGGFVDQLGDDDKDDQAQVAAAAAVKP